ncbi:MAG: histidine kinase N-terminal 7TM domain-containing protein, partial [Bacteroidota bacterium]
MESLVFVALAPIAAILMLVVALVAWRRRDQPGGLALVAFSLIEACWLSFDTLSVAAPSPEATLRLAQAGFLWCALLGAMWLAFVMEYTERTSRVARMSVAVLTAWCALYGVLAVTNEAHQLVWDSWETEVDGDFLVARYTLGPLAWVQTGFMWVAMLASYGLILWTYAGSSARTRGLSRWIVTGALAPLVLNVLYMLGLLELQKDFTPIAMAVSSGAFALGLARYQFLELRPVARAALVEELPEGVLVLDPENRVADVNPAF